MVSEGNKLSTTALAKKLDIPTQQLFATLKDYGWIERAKESWTLTQKGEFEGGSYHNSRRFGAYIVWPEELDGHPLLKAIESNQRITASSMCRYYPQLHARHINRALAELGLQQHSLLGWELTQAGLALGGLQEESNNTGAFYVSWPHELVDDPVVHRELSQQSDQMQPPVASTDGESDLFSSENGVIDLCRGIDAHSLDSPLHARVCDWLYLAQLAHACQRRLPVEEVVYADFYVPVGNIYIDCWEADVPAGKLSAKLRKQELYRERSLRHLEINAGDADKLDEVLGRGLLSFGIRW
jgi:hypothetical protein